MTSLNSLRLRTAKAVSDQIALISLLVFVSLNVPYWALLGLTRPYWDTSCIWGLTNGLTN